ncbi:hypothetical protein BC830DRAFT_848141 [Chytriomyces sp. MP71]|nr:hypothetical protein BC830DRAFT_848141 [Chytriomyces sp. MP71]
MAIAAFLPHFDGQGSNPSELAAIGNYERSQNLEPSEPEFMVQVQALPLAVPPIESTAFIEVVGENEQSLVLESSTTVVARFDKKSDSKKRVKIVKSITEESPSPVGITIANADLLPHEARESTIIALSAEKSESVPRNAVRDASNAQNTSNAHFNFDKVDQTGAMARRATDEAVPMIGKEHSKKPVKIIKAVKRERGVVISEQLSEGNSAGTVASEGNSLPITAGALVSSEESNLANDATVSLSANYADCSTIEPESRVSRVPISLPQEYGEIVAIPQQSMESLTLTVSDSAEPIEHRTFFQSIVQGISYLEQALEVAVLRPADAVDVAEVNVLAENSENSEVSTKSVEEMNWKEPDFNTVRTSDKNFIKNEASQPLGDYVEESMQPHTTLGRIVAGSTAMVVGSTIVTGGGGIAAVGSISAGAEVGLNMPSLHAQGKANDSSEEQLVTESKEESKPMKRWDLPLPVPFQSEFPQSRSVEFVAEKSDHDGLDG